MNSGFKRIIYLICLAALSLGMSAAGPVTVKTSLDSAYIIMGKQTTLKINVVQDRGTQGYFTNVGDTLISEIEVIRALPADTSSLGSDREEITQDIIIQSFDSGLYTINPFPSTRCRLSTITPAQRLRDGKYGTYSPTSSSTTGG